MEQETIEPEYIEMKKAYEIQINDNKIKIEMNNDEITFIMILGISYYKYIKKYTKDEIKKELDIYENMSIEKIYNYLIKSKYSIKEKEKKITINDKKEIKLEEKYLTNEEMIKILIEEIKYIKDTKNRENDKMNELIEMNNERNKKIQILENNYNALKELVYELDDKQKNKYKDEIIITYETEEEGNCDIFGEQFVEINKNNIDLNINGKNTKLISMYKLNEGDNNIKIIIKDKIVSFIKEIL